MLNVTSYCKLYLQIPVGVHGVDNTILVLIPKVAVLLEDCAV